MYYNEKKIVRIYYCKKAVPGLRKEVFFKNQVTQQVEHDWEKNLSVSVKQINNDMCE